MRREPHLPSYGRRVEDFAENIKARHVVASILVALAVTIFMAA